MAVSSKDLESLWQRYTVEAVPAGISVNQFFESNGVPYHAFEKWYKKKYLGLSNGMKIEHHNLSYFEQAQTYMTKHREELIAYVKIGSVQIDNNCW